MHFGGCSGSNSKLRDISVSKILSDDEKLLESNFTLRLFIVLISSIVLAILSISLDFVAQSNPSNSSGYSVYNFLNKVNLNHNHTHKSNVNTTWRTESLRNASAGETLCAYLQANPTEPELIFYNRMPKAGSSTMSALYETLAKRNTFGLWHAPRKFWGEMDKNIREFEENIITELTYYSHYIVDGHWNQRLFDTSLFHRNAEYIQLIRDCHGWVISQADYTLLDCEFANNAKKSHTYDDYVKEMLKINNTDIDACFADYDCLRHSGFLQSPNDFYGCVCGESCSAKYAHKNTVTPTLNNPDVFIAVGVLSQLEKYLYVLECAYPNILDGIKKLYLNQHIHSRKSNKRHNTPAFLTVVNETCDGSGKYKEMYAEAERILVNQYEYLLANSDKCCRRRY